MRDFLVLLLHSIVTVIRLTKPGGFRSVIAESVLIRHQLLILNRGRKRAPNLHSGDRIIAGLYTLFIRRARIVRSAIVFEAFHSAESSQPAEAAEVSVALFAQARASSWPQRPDQSTHRHRSGDETTESSLGLPSHRSPDRTSFWD